MANEIFTLEALNAKHGDALLLHYGTKKKPRVILIDGGPTGVYRSSIRPRFEELAETRGVTPLIVEHVFVTHLDSDHIRGVLDFAIDIKKGDAPAKSLSFWFNTFSDAMNELPPETAKLVKKAPTAVLASVDAVTASVAEGQSLRDTVRVLHAAVNGGSGKLLVADKKGVKLDVSSDLSVTLVCPSKEHLRKLALDWKKKAKPTQAETSAYLDNSVYNLSSLVMVVAAKNAAGKKRRMLLTGDARGDHVVAGLDAAGFLDSKGKAHFDILKVGHHGSDRDFEAQFFKDITADHYVISADGRFENPSQDVLEWIGEGATGDYKICMTNESGTGFPALEKNIAGALKKVKRLKGHLVFRDPQALSVRVDLFDATGF
ncbi:MAG: MBL fold metallo-hydrolase [Burkholderiales bacterium]